MAKIRNKITGEVREVSPQELSQYGLSSQRVDLGAKTSGFTQQEPVEPDRSIGGGLLNTLLGGVTRYGQAIGGGLGLRSRAQQEAEESQRRAEEMNRLLTQRAVQETDPQEQQRLLAASRSIGQNLSQLGQQQLESARRAIGMRPGEEEMSNLAFSGKRGGQFAADVGSWMMPTLGPATAGATGARAVGEAALRGGLTGGARSALAGLTHEDIDFSDPVDVFEKASTSAITGLAVGAAISSGMEASRQTLGWGIKRLSELARQHGLAPKQKSAEVVRKATQFSLEPQGVGEGAKEKFTGKDYTGFKSWARSIYNNADRKLKSLLSNQTLGIDDVISDSQAQKNFITTQNFVANELSKSPDPKLVAEGRRVNAIIKNLSDSGQLSAKDWLELKKIGDHLTNTIQGTASRGGQQVSDRVGGNLVSLAQSSNVIRNALREVGPKGTEELLKTQHYATIIGQASDTAALRFDASKAPNLRTISWILGGALGGGYVAMGGNPLMGAAIGATPFAVQLGIQSPQVQQAGYNLGDWLLKAGAKPATQQTEQLVGRSVSEPLSRFIFNK